jgi:hypothetical protein
MKSGAKKKTKSHRVPAYTLIPGQQRVDAETAVRQLLELSKGHTLGEDLSIEELIRTGRRE